MSIHPCYGDVRAMLWQNGISIYDFEATGVKDIMSNPDGLEIRLNEGESMFVDVLPSLKIRHSKRGKI